MDIRKNNLLRYVLWITLLLGLLGIGFSCHKKAEDGPLQISIWYPFGGLTGQFFNSLVQEYEQVHPDVRIESVYTGGYSVTARKIITGIVTDLLPEGGIIPAAPLFTGRVGNYRIENYLNGSNGLDRNAFFSVLWDFNAYHGRVCSLPFANSTLVLYYNKELLIKNGYDPLRPPQTWRELEAMARRIAGDYDKDGNMDVWGVVMSNQDWVLKSMIVQNGGAIIDSTGQIPLFNSAESVEILDYWCYLVNERLMPMAMHDRARAQFLGGRAVFLLASSGLVNTFITTAKFEIGTAFVPQFNEANPYSINIGGLSLALFPSEPEKEQATWKFFKWLLSEDVLNRWAVETGYIPLRKSSIESDLIQQLFAEYPQYRAGFEQIAFAQTYQHFWQMGGMDEYLRKAIEKVELGVIKPRQALDEAAQNLLSDICED